jgi:uncharacterized membrane protein YedE/YeeE
MSKLKYVILGFIFGVILIKSEVISWFRIQEMFRFQAFQMYGIIGSAVVVGMISIWLIKRFQVKTIYGADIRLEKKEFTWGTVIGGSLFGVGWAFTGACPGPLYALVGSGILIVLVVLVSALAGVYVYGLLKDKLPH